MSLWDKFQKELDRAGDIAKGALDEGKIRIEMFRVRQLADRAAEHLGYAVHRARREGRELDTETLERLDEVLGRHETEARRLEVELAVARKQQGDSPDSTADAAAQAATDAASGTTSPPRPEAPTGTAAGPSGTSGSGL